MEEKMKIGKYRWTILSLVFFATTINYLDRQVISLLKDDYLAPMFKWSETDYAYIVIIFQLSYSIAMLGVGWVIDKIGTKLGYAFALLGWSFAAISHAFAGSTMGFLVARSALGISESGNFPAAIKTVAEWFPKKERALATGIFNSGSNVGAIIAPLTVPLIALTMGWQWAFIITGTIGLIWLVFWFLIYEIPTKNKKLSKAEFDFIHSDKDETESNKVVNEKVSWLKLLTYKQTWAFVIGKFFTDGPWWFYLFWLPSFLNKQYGMTQLQLAFPIAAVYTMTTFGSVFGGWISGFLINRGWEVFKARRVAMLIFALCVLPIISAQSLGQNGYWYAVIIIGIAASAHQAWSANLFTTVSDMFPKKAVASIIGIGGMAGGFGGIFVSRAAGWLLDHYTAIGSIETGYYIMFIFCGTIYLLAWIIFNLLAPKMKRVVL
jgi:ACS family hexuronate transporter-like MFS transporter